MGARKIKAGIYMIMNTENQKCYIGYSTNITSRWYRHKYHLRKGTHTNNHLQKAWNKYGEKFFTFSVVEYLPIDLSVKEYEQVETKWVLFYKSNESKYGYNAIMPGGYSLFEEYENITENSVIGIICINTSNGEVEIFRSTREIINKFDVSYSRLTDLYSYWLGNQNRRKSWKGLIFIKEQDYDPSFDYINFKKQRVISDKPKKTWRDYELTRKKKYVKKVEKISKCVSVVAINIETNEEIVFGSVKEACKQFDRTKLYKCLNNEFGKYKHRGFYFKRI